MLNFDLVCLYFLFVIVKTTLTVVPVPSGYDPTTVCSITGYLDVNGNSKNRLELAKVLNDFGVSDAYMASYNKDYSGFVLSNTGKLRPYNKYTTPTSYAICSVKLMNGDTPKYLKKCLKRDEQKSTYVGYQQPDNYELLVDYVDASYPYLNLDLVTGGQLPNVRDSGLYGQPNTNGPSWSDIYSYLSSKQGQFPNSVSWSDFINYLSSNRGSSSNSNFYNYPNYNQKSRYNRRRNRSSNINRYFRGFYFGNENGNYKSTICHKCAENHRPNYNHQVRNLTNTRNNSLSQKATPLVDYVE